MAPYIEAIDSQQLSYFIIRCFCDILRIRWESTRSRTKEHALLMMDKLIMASRLYVLESYEDPPTSCMFSFIEIYDELLCCYLKSRSFVISGLTNHLTAFEPRTDLEVYWLPPKPPWFKVNVDGAVFSSLKSVDVGIIIWDHYGQVAAAMSRLLEAPLGPLETEAKAMKRLFCLLKTLAFKMLFLRVILYQLFRPSMVLSARQRV